MVDQEGPKTIFILWSSKSGQKYRKLKMHKFTNMKIHNQTATLTNNKALILYYE